MKRLFLLLILAVAITACKKDPEPFRLDPNAKVYVKPSSEIQTKSSDHLSPLEVVKQATTLRLYNDISFPGVFGTATWVGKDTISAIPALLRWGTDIIYDTTGNGDYGIQKDFIYGYDMVICRGLYPNYDTIAYIPNAIVLNAREAILLAFEKKDTKSVYELFQEAFRFIPITGAEYKQLKGQGLQ
jgi:hypothetical protein